VPRRSELYNIYEDFLTTDAHLRSVFEKFLMGAVMKDWQFMDKNGQEVPHMKDWIDSPDFEMVCREIAATKGWGYTMLEFDFYDEKNFGVFLIPRKHMRPHRGVVAFEQTG